MVVVRSLKDEQEAPSTSTRIDFDGKLPLFAPSVFRRRFILGTITGTALALGADFLGSTSAILSLNPELFRGLRVDVLYPIGGYKRCLETSQGFEFIFPKTWVGDQTLLYRAVQRGERERSLDLPPIRQPSKRRLTEPIVAFGPPGTLGELNVSVVVAPVAQGFTLEKLGNPTEAGITILKRSIAPEGSNKVAELIDAAARRDDAGVTYYTLEYTVRGPSFYRHNVAVYAVSSSAELYTLSAQSPETMWSDVRNQFKIISDSFRLVSSI